MSKNKRTVRCAILCRLFEHLEVAYGIDWSRDLIVKGQLSLHQIDALLAFKSDALIDELRSALDRLDSGVYGICSRCKRRISDKLLDHDPARRVCNECEEEFSHSTLYDETIDVQMS
jgi:hypothetical protein